MKTYINIILLSIIISVIYIGYYDTYSDVLPRSATVVNKYPPTGRMHLPVLVVKLETGSLHDMRANWSWYDSVSKGDKIVVLLSEYDINPKISYILLEICMFVFPFLTFIICLLHWGFNND